MEQVNYDIKKFLSITRYNNGRKTITNDANHEGNICMVLCELGYGFVRTNGRRIYFHNDGFQYNVVKVLDIKHAFRDFLQINQFENIPNDISRTDILNWFYKKNPIKINGIFERYLERKLTQSEINKFSN